MEPVSDQTRQSRCPCRKKSETTTYADCCAPYHDAVQPAPSAEKLMRSRYAAFVLKDAAYLTTTWHRSTRPAFVDFMPGQEWLLLRIISTLEDGDEATVEFVARSRLGGTSSALHEISRFVRENDRWFYVDGTVK
jgi:SEC-C motif domain protein